MEYLGLDDVACHMTQKDFVWALIRTAMSSVADLCIVPIQDYLTLGGEARMNFPGTTTSANWTWRAEAGFANDQLAKRILAMTKLYGRLAPEPKAEEASVETDAE